MANKGILSKERLDSNEILSIEVKKLSERIGGMEERYNILTAAFKELKDDTIQDGIKALSSLILICKDELIREIRERLLTQEGSNSGNTNNNIGKQSEHLLTLIIDILEKYLGYLSSIDTAIKVLGNKLDSATNVTEQAVTGTSAKKDIRPEKPQKWWQLPKYYLYSLPLYRISKFYCVYIQPIRWFLIASVFVILGLIIYLVIRENMILRSLCGF